MTNVKCEIQKQNEIKISVDDRIGIVRFSEEFINRGPFTQPLNQFDFFKQAYYDDEQGLIMWPNTFGISIDEIYFVLGYSNIVEVT